jgi:hypothetical protein
VDPRADVESRVQAVEEGGLDGGAGRLVLEEIRAVW